MANTKTKNSISSDKESVTATVKTDAAAEAKTTESDKIVPKEPDLSQLITVYNGFHGKLAYKSRRTGEQFRWSEFGAEQEMELRELKNAKSSSKAFFENNWFMFGEDDQWVIDYLGVGKYYKYAVNLDAFDNIFDMSQSEIKKVVSSMSSGQKESLAYRARQLVRDGTIDSRKVVSSLEEVLGIELIEK